MKNRSFLVLGVVIALCHFSGKAQTFTEWQDPQVNAVNRLPMHSHYFAYESVEKAEKGIKEESANFRTLNGLWKFFWVNDADARPTDFYKTDFNDRGWNSIHVPGIWEMNGYGYPVYVGDGYAWKGQYKNNPPIVPVENNHVGSYRREITIPADWKGKEIIAHFGSVISNLYLWVNGKFVGYSEDSRLEAEFDLTPYLKPGKKNLIAFQAFRWCDGSYLEDQDMLLQCGVARDCYLYARNKKHVADVRITPDLDEQYRDGSLAIRLEMNGSGKVDLELLDPQNRQVAAKTLNASGKITTSMEVENPLKWTAETPYLYTLRVILRNGDRVTEVIPVKVGFRKIELRNSQIWVNGQPVLFKGVDRHETDPDKGRAISRERMIQDIRLMKEFNINAVRTSHYPSDNFWYDLCDEYGIYLVAEANLESHGMKYKEATLAKEASYRKAHLERNMRNVQRNFNHPSVIFWSLGNESGYGPNFELAYDWVKKEDPSRAVQYQLALSPAQNNYEGKTDIVCPMYYTYEDCIRYCEDPSRTKPLIQCEFAHAMGNSLGGFKEYMDLMRKYPNYQGGFIWEFVDHSVRWKGKEGNIIYGYGGDFNHLDYSVNGHYCNKGLVNADRRPYPQTYEVGYFYQNIWTTPADLKNGEINVYNENFFRDLSAYYMDWSVWKEGEMIRSGRVENLKVAPQQTAKIKLETGEFSGEGEYVLNVSYKLKDREGLLPIGHEVAKEQLVLNPYRVPAMDLENERESTVEAGFPVVQDHNGNYLIVKGEDYRIEFAKTNGLLTRYEVGGLSLIEEGGALRPNFWRAPTDNDFGAKLQQKYGVWRNPDLRLVSLKHRVENQQVIVEAIYEMKRVSATLNLTYRVNDQGALKVTQQLVVDKNAKHSNMFRFGMQMPMPESFDRIEYYGRGPIENYVDRNHAMKLGVYRQKVSEQYFPYVRPQESGSKTDVRWWMLLNQSGKGIKVVASAPFTASALPYSIEELDKGWEVKQMHSTELKESGQTTFCIDKLQSGLGCIDSWGALPLPQYQMPYQDYELTFILTPVSGQFEME